MNNYSISIKWFSVALIDGIEMLDDFFALLHGYLSAAILYYPWCCP